MSKTTDMLRSVGVFNDHGFFDGDGVRGTVWITYVSDRGRGGVGCYASMQRKGHKTDPNGPWYHHGNKALRSFRTPRPANTTERAHCIALAQEWASERYGITEWARTPFGGYGDAAYVKARLAELKRQAKASVEVGS
jgi:hypothetical protein